MKAHAHLLLIKIDFYKMKPKHFLKMNLSYNKTMTIHKLLSVFIKLKLKLINASFENESIIVLSYKLEIKRLNLIFTIELNLNVFPNTLYMDNIYVHAKHGLYMTQPHSVIHCVHSTGIQYKMLCTLSHAHSNSGDINTGFLYLIKL